MRRVTISGALTFTKRTSIRTSCERFRATSTTRAIRMPISQVRQFDRVSSLFIGPPQVSPRSRSDGEGEAEAEHQCRAEDDTGARHQAPPAGIGLGEELDRDQGKHRAGGECE